MRIRRFASSVVLIPAAVIAAACGRGNAPVADDALKNDLSLAAQAQPAQPFASPLEAGYAAPQQARQVQAVARRPVATAPVRRTSTSRSSAGTVYRAPEPVYRTEKHTTRDAAIGAAAGAVIGATTSRDKVKGGIIGAAAGGIIGAVIGNNVDVKKVPF